MAEHNMGIESHVERPNRSKSGRVDAVVLLAFTTFGFLVGWVIVEYLHNVYLQQYLSITIRSPGSVLRAALPLGILSVAVSVILRARGNRRLRPTPDGSVLLPRSTVQPTVSHPLFLFERPARDSKFVVRRTRASGRISRIREAERLPPSELA